MLYSLFHRRPPTGREIGMYKMSQKRKIEEKEKKNSFDSLYAQSDPPQKRQHIWGVTCTVTSCQSGLQGSQHALLLIKLRYAFLSYTVLSVYLSVKPLFLKHIIHPLSPSSFLTSFHYIHAYLFANSFASTLLSLTISGHSHHHSFISFLTLHQSFIFFDFDFDCEVRTRYVNFLEVNITILHFIIYFLWAILL